MKFTLVCSGLAILCIVASIALSIRTQRRRMRMLERLRELT